MRTTVDEIRLMGSDLSDGESVRTICPVCGGGTSSEQTFVVSRDIDGLVWHCFRAGCGTKGATGGAGASRQTSNIRKPSPKWEGKTYPIPDMVKERIHTLWGLSEVPPTWFWTTDRGGRVAMSILSPSGSHRGWVLRSLKPEVKPKALTYVNEDEEGMSWYKTQPYRGTVIVEDIPSAVRASSYVNAVALLGTGIGLDRAQEIAGAATRPIIMALDQDATAQSFRWAKKYSLIWEDVIVLPLSKDIKDSTEEELQGIFYERETRTSKYNTIAGGI